MSTISMTQLWALEFSSKLYFFWVWSHPLETIESSRLIIFSCSYEDTCFVPQIPRRRSYAAIASLNQEKNSQKQDSEMFQVSRKRLRIPGLLPYDMGARRKEAMRSFAVILLAHRAIVFMSSREQPSWLIAKYGVCLWQILFLSTFG